MTVTILIIFCLTGNLVYYYYLHLARLGLKKEQQGLILRKYSVSVVVAARDEEDNIRELLTRLINQNYDTDSYEVIIADDESRDATADIVKQFSAKYNNIILHQVTRKDGKISPKKQALQQAIEKAQGKYILITDADCQPGTNWIRSMVSRFAADTDMVVGFSRTAREKKFAIGSAEWFEHFDFLAMFAVAGGLILQDKPFSCSAQNLAYKKESWEKVGGYGRIMHIISGDDVNLMQLFRQAGMKITFNLFPGSFMTTTPVTNWFKLLNQRSRWASNTRFQLSLNPEFFVYLMSVLITTFLPWVLLFFYWQAGVVFLVFRLIIEMNFVKKAFKQLQAEQKLWLGYPLWLVIQPVYMLTVGLGGLFSFYRWKK